MCHYIHSGIPEGNDKYWVSAYRVQYQNVTKRHKPSFVSTRIFLDTNSWLLSDLRQTILYVVESTRWRYTFKLSSFQLLPATNNLRKVPSSHSAQHGSHKDLSSDAQQPVWCNVCSAQLLDFVYSCLAECLSRSGIPSSLRGFYKCWISWNL